MNNRKPNRHAQEGISDLVLEVPYPNGHVRMVMNDTLPWTSNEALMPPFVSRSDAEIQAFHIEAIEQKIEACIAVSKSMPFRQRHPDTALENVRIVLRFRNLPIPSVSGFMTHIEHHVKNEGMQFAYGYGGDTL